MDRIKKIMVIMKIQVQTIKKNPAFDEKSKAGCTKSIREETIG